MYVYMHTYICVCIHTYIHTTMHMFVHVCMYIYIEIVIYIHKHRIIYRYTHTRKQTHTQSCVNVCTSHTTNICMCGMCVRGSSTATANPKKRNAKSNKINFNPIWTHTRTHTVTQAHICTHTYTHRRLHTGWLIADKLQRESPKLSSNCILHTHSPTYTFNRHFVFHCLQQVRHLAIICASCHVSYLQLTNQQEKKHS